MLPRCQFKHNGRPTTQPGTEADALRIRLSKWITDVLVRSGDEKPGDYQTPDVAGDLQDFITRVSEPEKP